MREFNFATTPRRTGTYRNRQTPWSEIVNHLKLVTLTRETFAEYEAMSKADRQACKDTGGFVLGYCAGGVRTSSSVRSRSGGCLDVDAAPADLPDLLAERADFAYYLYTTHSHSPAHPRYRIIIPFSRDVTPEEYEPVMRKVADTVGEMSWYDDTTFEYTRLMYNPSHAKDGEYICREGSGEFLDPDAILGSYPDWRDVSTWPSSGRRELHVQTELNRAEDPCTKRAYVGAFCRTYSISEAIEKFLPEVYTAAGEGRYTYAQGSSFGGAVVYEDKFLYSHHSTDPAAGKLLNAYDLVRLHKFANESEISTPDSFLTGPSIRKMNEFCRADHETQVEYGRTEMTSGADEFAEDLTGTPEEPAEKPDFDWTAELERHPKTGDLLPTVKNYELLLRHDPHLKNIGGVDEFMDNAVVFGDLPWRKVSTKDTLWRDEDDANVLMYVESKFHMYHEARYQKALTVVHSSRRFHPIRDYLRGLEWDGTARVATMLIDYMGVEDNVYTRAVAVKWMAGAVARVMEPGIKFDFVPILCGGQGIGKSTFCRILGGEWFSNSIHSLTGKDAIEQIHAAWIDEVGELEAFSRADVRQLKNFLTIQEDKYRKAYARRVTKSPRQCVLIGTSNEYEVLRDWTGDRRFWPVDCHEEMAVKSVFHDMENERDQLWAEAYLLYQQYKDKKLDLWMSKPEEARLALAAQRDHTALDPIFSKIQDFLNVPLPADWDKKDQMARKTWLKSYEEGKESGTYSRQIVCPKEIWIEGLNCSESAFDQATARKIGTYLRSIGWQQQSGSVRYRDYGRQRVFKKC